MSEKRFTTDYFDLLKCNKTWIKRGDERLTYEEIVDLLNSLNEENEQLKITNLRLQQRIDDLEKKRRPMRWSE